ncbi:MAG: hypothetical protein JEZ02_17245 [Desulfatibacillum sp.]|nr:hypothetical protein [Desulfatibacillum sp.]
MINRPSNKELQKRLTEAKAAISQGRKAVENLFSLIEDLNDFGYLMKDFTQLLPDILEEVKPRHYAGQRPPASAYASQIRGKELWAFSWKSKIVGCEVYFKFAFKDDMLWIVSFHKSRPRSGE